jgi:hypothetical protein
VHEAYPLLGELVDVRRFDFLLAVAAQVTIAQIVSHYKDDVWMLRRLFLSFDELAVAGSQGQRGCSAGCQIEKFTSVQVIHVFILSRYLKQ